MMKETNFNIFVLSFNMDVVFSKGNDVAATELQLRTHMSPYWDDAILNHTKNSVHFNGVSVVFQAVGQLMIVVSGLAPVFDEFVLSDVIDNLIRIVHDVLGNTMTPRSFLETINFSKIVLAFDEEEGNV